MHEFAPVGRLAASAMKDPIPQVRMKALQLLIYGDPDTATGYFSMYLYDEHPEVTELAANLLDEFEQRQQRASN